MLIDPFTVAAQLLNFLILLFLLKRFLYGPILGAVARREEKIFSQFEEARRRSEETQREAEKIEKERRQIGEERERGLEEARREAQERRDELLKKAKEEAEEVRRAWKESLRSEKDRFFDEFRRRAGAEVLRIGRRAFADLAGEDVDVRIVEAFLAKIEGLDAKRKEALRIDDGGTVRVTTPAELTISLKKRVTAGIHRAAGREVEVAYETDAAMTPGIRLDAGGTRLSWNVEDYFDAMEKYLCEVLEVPAGDCREEPAAS